MPLSPMLLTPAPSESVRLPVTRDTWFSNVGEGAVVDGPPSHAAEHRKVRWLHNGQAKSLRAVLTGEHPPEKVVGQGELLTAELVNTLAHLESL